MIEWEENLKFNFLFSRYNLWAYRPREVPDDRRKPSRTKAASKDDADVIEDKGTKSQVDKRRKTTETNWAYSE